MRVLIQVDIEPSEYDIPPTSTSKLDDSFSLIQQLLTGQTDWPEDCQATVTLIGVTRLVKIG